MVSQNSLRLLHKVFPLLENLVSIGRGHSLSRRTRVSHRRQVTNAAVLECFPEIGWPGHAASEVGGEEPSDLGDIQGDSLA